MISFKDVHDRNEAYDLYTPYEKESCERVALNAQLLYLLAIKKGIYPDNNDLNIDYAKYIFEACKFYDIGNILIKDSDEKAYKMDIIEYGSRIFYKDIVNYEEINRLSKEEKIIRKFAKDACLYCNEKWNGTGLPNGLAKEEIPIIGRIVAVAKALEMVTKHSTAKKDEALDSICYLSYTNYDPELIKILTDNLDTFIIRTEKKVNVNALIDNYVIETIAKEKVEIVKQQEPDEIKGVVVAKEEVKPEAKIEEGNDAKEESKPDASLEAKEEVKPEVKEEVKPEVKEEPKPEIKHKLISVDNDLVDDNKVIEKPNLNKTSMKIRPIQVHYYPVKDSNDKICLYYSDLVINSDYYGTLEPVTYEIVAERSSQLADMKIIEFDQIIELLKIANKYKIDIPMVAIKLNYKLFERKTFVSKIKDKLIKSKFANKIIFVIDENFVNNINELLLNTLNEFVKIGVKVGVINLGFDFSFVQRINNINFDYLFINDRYLKNGRNIDKILGVIKGLKNISTSFNANIICQGVNNENQIKLLNEIGIDKLQGNAIGEYQTMFDLLS